MLRQWPHQTGLLYFTFPFRKSLLTKTNYDDPISNDTILPLPHLALCDLHTFSWPGSQKTGKNVENELKVGYKIQPDTILQYPGHSTLPILPGKEIADWDCRRGNLWSEICECGNRLCFVCLLLSNLQIIAADIRNARTGRNISDVRTRLKVSNPRTSSKQSFISNQILSELLA